MGVRLVLELAGDDELDPEDPGSILPGKLLDDVCRERLRYRHAHVCGSGAARHHPLRADLAPVCRVRHPDAVERPVAEAELDVQRRCAPHLHRPVGVVHGDHEGEGVGEGRRRSAVAGAGDVAGRRRSGDADEAGRVDGDLDRMHEGERPDEHPGDREQDDDPAAGLDLLRGHDPHSEPDGCGKDGEEVREGWTR